MKLKLLTLLLPLCLLAGCVKNIQAPVPGQLNAFDATSYRVLTDAQAAIDSVKNSAITAPLTSTQKVVLNQAIADYNIAEASWQAYHAGGTTNTAALTSAINTLVADIAAISTQIKGGK
jgi:hypothetical protein